jgi:hypothetical protein
MTCTTLLVRKDRIADARLRTDADPPLADGQVRVGLDLLALTANNITYAAFGEAMDYWRFFPSGEEGWGIVPVWGFGHVVQSLHPGVAVGERLYGYWPMASSAVLAPDRLSPEGWRDGAAHRSGLHAIYNQYLRCSADPFWRAETEDLQVLLRPLFTTAWLIDDFLADNGDFGAARCVLSSASSKTAYATAWLLAQRGVRVTGLTSAANRGFCASLGCYAEVVGYDEVETWPADAATVYIDFAGNAGLRRTLHTRLADQLRYSCAVGGTHVDQLGGGGGLPGPRPVLFFAPAQAKKRQSEWGAAQLQQRIVEAWNAFLQQVQAPGVPWLQARRADGGAAALAAYAEVLGGRTDPRIGQVLRIA